MTKKSAFVLALGMMAAVLSAAVAMSLNFGIGDSAEGAPLVKTEQESTKKAEKRKPIVKTRRITIKRERQAPGGGGAVTVVRSAPSGGSAPSVRSTSDSSGEFEDHESEHESEHEDEHEEEHEGGDD